MTDAKKSQSVTDQPVSKVEYHEESEMHEYADYASVLAKYPHLIGDESFKHARDSLDRFVTALKEIDGGILGQQACERGMDLHTVRALATFSRVYAGSEHEQASRIAKSFIALHLENYNENDGKKNGGQVNHRELSIGERVACAARSRNRTPETLSQRTTLPVSLIRAIYADKCHDEAIISYLAKPLGVSEVWLKTGKINRDHEKSCVMVFLQTAKETCAKIRELDHSGIELPEATLGRRVELLRQSLGMTALHVKKKVRIPADTVRDIEQGIVAPTGKQIYLLSRALNSSVEWIEHGVGSPFKANEHEVDKEVQVKL
jgi:ribosome-binding protein aMBF1 (putative translation factor)